MAEPGVAVVIEDDADMRNLVQAVLQQSGFDVHAESTGKEGVETVRREGAAVVTLDVGLPDIDGYEVLRRIREFSDCYVVMLTARSDELDTLTGLQSGADDYLTKPFRPRELRARISAMQRRPRLQQSQMLSGGAAEEQPATAERAVPPRPGIEHNGLVLVPETRTATLRGGELNLTRSEFDLLHELLRSRGAVRTKSDLVRVVRGEYYREGAYISEADERAIEVHMGNLHRKIGEDTRQPRWLQTVRGVGYRLAPKRPEYDLLTFQGLDLLKPGCGLIAAAADEDEIAGAIVQALFPDFPFQIHGKPGQLGCAHHRRSDLQTQDGVHCCCRVPIHDGLPEPAVPALPGHHKIPGEGQCRGSGLQLVCQILEHSWIDERQIREGVGSGHGAILWRDPQSADMGGTALIWRRG